MMNRDPHPGVRAWSSRAAWNWWIWNPPVRARLNQAFLTSLEQPEPSALAETAKRFQTEALRPGTYVVVLRVRDAAGNYGSGDVVFAIK